MTGLRRFDSHDALSLCFSFNRRSVNFLPRNLLSLTVLTLVCGCREGDTEYGAPGRGGVTSSGVLRLCVEPSPISLGVLAVGEGRQALVQVLNHSRQPQVVDRFLTSCPCISLEPAPVLIAPGGSATIMVRFDPSAEPEFRGRLSVDVTGVDGASTQLETHVDLEVRERATLQVDPLPSD